MERLFSELVESQRALESLLSKPDDLVQSIGSVNGYEHVDVTALRGLLANTDQLRAVRSLARYFAASALFHCFVFFDEHRDASDAPGSRLDLCVGGRPVELDEPLHDAFSWYWYQSFAAPETGAGA